MVTSFYSFHIGRLVQLSLKCMKDNFNLLHLAAVFLSMDQHVVVY